MVLGSAGPARQASGRRGALRPTGFLTAATVAALGLTACGGTDAAPSAPHTTHKALRVGIAYDVGGRGDKSFHDAAAAGLERAKKDLDVQIKELEAEKGENDEERYSRLKLLCDAGYNPIIAVGLVYVGDPKTGPLTRAVNYCPKAKFAIIDEASVTAPNLANLIFAEEQGSFLVGAAAALKTRTDHIGFISGCQVDTLRKFHAGFQAGARAVKPRIKIEASYLSTLAESCSGFNDSPKAKIEATRMYGRGADVVFQAAGASGIGVFEAAKARHAWAIGVDSDQYQMVSADLRDVIITSMIKRVDVAVYDFVEQVAAGRFTAGVTKFDLASDGVGYASSGGKVEDIKPRLEAFRQQIREGKIKVPTTP